MRLGLAGAGRIGRMHARILAEHPSVGSVLVADPDRTSAQHVAQTHGFDVASAVDELFDGGLDGLVVTAATDVHAELLLRSAKSGLPVFVEKPVAMDVAGTLEVIRAVENAAVAVQVGFQRRFDPGYVAARDAVASGALGAVHTLRSCTLDPAPPTPAYVAASGGLFRDCAVHDFDSIRWVSGREIVTVSAVGANRGEEFFAEVGDVDTASALLTLEDDAIALVSCTRYNAAGYDVRLEVLGQRGSVSAGLDDHTPLRSTEPGVTFPGTASYTAFPDRFVAAYRSELDAFVRQVVADGAASPCTPVDALEAFYVAEAAELARRERRTVVVEEVRR